MQHIRYVECTLTIKDREHIAIEYEDSGKTRECEGKLGPDPFAYLTVERLNHWVKYALRMQEQSIKDRLYDIQDLRVIGLNLYRILFGDDSIQQRFVSAYERFDTAYRQEKAKNPAKAPDLRMRLRLVFEREAERLGLGTLPWEFLFVPGEGNDIKTGFFFSGEKTELILTRFVPPSALVFDAKPEPLRILVVVSRAQVGMGCIDEKETKALISQLNGISRADVKVVEDPTYRQLSDEIGNKTLPHILHFIGHGGPGELAIFKDAIEDDYDVEKGGQQLRLLTSEQFRSLFNEHKPRLIFLHACKGAAAPASHEGFISTARELVYAEIPAVVAMQYSISNQDAGRFARKFYEELGNGCKIDEAVKAGRLELGKTFPPWEHPRFGTPVVYLQTFDAIVLPVLEPKREEGQKAADIGKTPLTGSQFASNVIVAGVSVGGEPSVPVTAPTDNDVDRSDFRS